MVFPSASKTNVSIATRILLYFITDFVDVVDIEGVDSNIGFTQWANKSSTQDSHVRTRITIHHLPCPKIVPQLVAQFRAAGAIPIVKTNVPQVCLIRQGIF